EWGLRSGGRVARSRRTGIHAPRGRHPGRPRAGNLGPDAPGYGLVRVHYAATPLRHWNETLVRRRIAFQACALSAAAFALALAHGTLAGGNDVKASPRAALEMAHQAAD